MSAPTTPTTRTTPTPPARQELAPPHRARLRRERGVLVTAVSCAALLGLVVVGLTAGEVRVPLPEVVDALLGRTTGGSAVVVVQWRLPRVLLAVLLGAALALSGALFQVVTRNPLGSPDILGFTTGATTGALLVMLGGTAGAGVGAPASMAATTTGALGGGLATAVVIWLLVVRAGARGPRLVLVGIGITALLNAVNVLLLTRADERAALRAALWGAGSLNGVSGAWVAPVALAVGVLAVAVAALTRSARVYELGDDLAGSLGLSTGGFALAAMAVGVALVAVATAVAGPIAFVALAAPQIARRLWRTGTVPLAPTALTGAVLLLASDVVAQRLLAPTILPTGLVTICLGGAYLAWALTRRGGR